MGMGVLGRAERVAGENTVGWVIMNPSLPSLWGSLFAQLLRSDAVISASLIPAAHGMVGVWAGVWGILMRLWWVSHS